MLRNSHRETQNDGSHGDFSPSHPPFPPLPCLGRLFFGEPVSAKWEGPRQTCVSARGKPMPRVQARNAPRGARHTYPRSGTMKRHATIVPTFALVAALGVCVPATAGASAPLLSGYGGPGTGSQAILGSTLLGGGSSQ